MTQPRTVFRFRRSALLAGALATALGFGAAEIAAREIAPATWPQTRALAHERDDHGAAAYAALTAPASGPRVIIIGGSAAREGLPPPALLSGAFADALGADEVFAQSLATFDQTLSETARLVGALPLDGDATLVLTVNPRRLSHGEASFDAELSASRLALAPRGGLCGVVHAPLDRRCAQPRSRLLELKLFVSNMLTSRLRGDVREGLEAAQRVACGVRCVAAFARRDWLRPVSRYIRFAYPPEPLADDAKDAIAARIPIERTPEYQANADFAEGLLVDIITYAQQRGATVLLADLPRESRSRAGYAAIADDYEERMARIAEETGATYLDWSAHPAFPDEAFYDLDHLLPPWRSTLAEALSAALAEIR